MEIRLYISHMKIILLCLGPTDIAHVQESILIYTNRLQHYLPFEVVTIPDQKSWKKLDIPTRKIEEGKSILAQLLAGDRAVLLDEKGKQYTSEDFADYLQKEMNSGIKRLVFIIGGAFGFSKEVYAQVPLKISLSKMTFSHQMIRTLILEQIYRGMTILRNEPYHNR